MYRWQRKSMRRRGSYGEIDKGNHREGFCRRVIDGNIVRSDKKIEDENIRIGEQEVKALDHENGERGF